MGIHKSNMTNILFMFICTLFVIICILRTTNAQDDVVTNIGDVAVDSSVTRVDYSGKPPRPDIYTHIIDPNLPVIPPAFDCLCEGKISFVGWRETHWDGRKQCRTCEEITQILADEEAYFEDVHTTPCVEHQECGFGNKNINIRSHCAAAVLADQAYVWDIRKDFYDTMFPQESLELKVFIELCGRPMIACSPTRARCVGGRCTHFAGPDLPPPGCVGN